MTATWWHDHANLVVLTRFMVGDGHTADEVAYAVEKPWKHDDLWGRARQQMREDRQFAQIASNYRAESFREALAAQTVRTYTIVELVDVGLDGLTETTCPECEGSTRQPGRDVACMRCAGYGRVYWRAAS